MDTTDIELEPGMNRLPKLYNPSCWAASNGASVRASITPALGTTPTEPRDPGGATVVFPMDWMDALRMALSILSMAQDAQVKLPAGVVVPDRDWTQLTSNREAH